MPNSGLRSGIGSRWRPYRPVLMDNSVPGVVSTFGTGLFTGETLQIQVGAQGFYTVIDGMCVFHANFVWGSGGTNGSGSQYLISLPVAPRPLRDAASSDYFIGTGMYGGIFGIHDTPIAIYTVADDYNNERGNTAPGWCHGIIGHYTQCGTATVANATTSIAVNHNMGSAPDAVTITPNGSPSASACDMNHTWVDTIGASQFTIHAQTSAAGNLTAGQGFNWQALRTGNVILGPVAPFAFGSSGDHIELFGMYPAINR